MQCRSSGDGVGECQALGWSDRAWKEIQRRTQDFLDSPLMGTITVGLEGILRSCGVPPPYPEADQIALCFTAVVLTLLLYFLLFGKRHRRRRLRLAKDLREARSRVQELEEKLLELELAGDTDGDSPKSRKPVRIWMDGCFDIMHYGHMNAFRQGKALGTHLVVGVNSDETIIACKGPPVMNDEERITAVEGCRFVDEVVRDVPYVMNEPYLMHIIDKYQIDFVVHGDDPCIVDGKDVYELPKKMGKYKSIPRTEGVSTTDIVGRMLLMSTSHHQKMERSQSGRLASGSDGNVTFYRPSKFLTTSRMIRLFSVGMKGAPEPGAKVVYVDGSWDMFHAGHVKTLKRVKEQFGGYLIVGVHNDQVVNKHRGSNLPIMNLHERVLSVLGCKYVDDVLIDAPYGITREMIASLKISVVVHGLHKGEYRYVPEHGGPEIDPHAVPKEMGIFHEISSDCDLSVRNIIHRIRENQEQLSSKFVKKIKVEQQYYEERYKAHSPPKANGGSK